MKKVFTIGRDPQSDIVINDNTDVVSRLHASIRFDGNKMFLIDQSQNGTYVNGMRMSPNEEIPVTREDIISFANVSQLDWSALPNPKVAAYKTIGIILAILLAIVVIAFGVLYYTTNNVDEPQPQNVETKADQAPEELTNKESVVGKKEEKTDSAKNVTNPVEPEVKGNTGQRTKASKKQSDKEKTDLPKDEKKDNTQSEGEIPLY